MTEPSNLETAPERALDQESATPAEIPWHLWAVGGAALLASLAGLVEAVFSLTGNAWYFKQLGYGRSQIDYFTDLGWLAAAVWAIAVFTGVAGALFLLSRRRVAVPLLLASAVAHAVLLAVTYGSLNRWTVLGGSSLTAGLLGLVIALGATGYAWWLSKQGGLISSSEVTGLVPRRAA
ncbi:MAG TPA: hypothetical protein PKV13_03510 [Propionicimonas sp.]|nr:hypothetical protein [Propionicimonas sp.]HRA05667.1 hypothetical protein [Propionicimonas sp.]